MKKYFFTIIIFILSCAPTEPVETYDDNAILQIFLNMADSSAVDLIRNEFDIDGNGTLDCMELPNTMEDSVVCTLENGRFTKLKLNNMGLSGNIPENKSHFVIDNPESVNLVNPPTIIINATSKVINNNHLMILLFLFSSNTKLIYISME